MSVSSILEIKTFLGTVSKAFEMLIAVTRDVRAGLSWLNPSRIDRERDVSKVDVEWRDWKSC